MNLFLLTLLLPALLLGLALLIGEALALLLSWVDALEAWLLRLPQD